MSVNKKVTRDGELAGSGNIADQCFLARLSERFLLRSSSAAAFLAEGTRGTRLERAGAGSGAAGRRTPGRRTQAQLTIMLRQEDIQRTLRSSLHASTPARRSAGADLLVVALLAGLAAAVLGEALL